MKSLEEIFDEFWKEVEAHNKCHIIPALYCTGLAAFFLGYLIAQLIWG